MAAGGYEYDFSTTLPDRIVVKFVSVLVETHT